MLWGSIGEFPEQFKCGLWKLPSWFITVFNFRIGTKWVFANIPKENSELYN